MEPVSLRLQPLPDAPEFPPTVCNHLDLPQTAFQTAKYRLGLENPLLASLRLTRALLSSDDLSL